MSPPLPSLNEMELSSDAPLPRRTLERLAFGSEAALKAAELRARGSFCNARALILQRAAASRRTQGAVGALSSWRAVALQDWT